MTTLRPLSPHARVILSVLALGLALFPLYGGQLLGGQYDFWLQKLTSVMILAMMAASLNLLVGVTGLVSVAHAAFFGLAGYTMVLVAPKWEAASLWVLLPAALLAAALAALLMGMLIIRTSGIFFIMATIAFSQMLFYIFHDTRIAGGSDGAYLFSAPTVELFGRPRLDLGDRLTLFYVTLISLAGVYLLLRALVRSPFGRVLLGIHVNEQRVQALGYNPISYKLTAFVIAGTLAGYAGVLSATQFRFVEPGQVGWHLSAEVLIMVILGGVGTLWGPILGAFAFEGLHHVFTTLTPHWELPLGLAVILIVLLLPNGIAGAIERFGDRSSRRPGAERRPAEPAADDEQPVSVRVPSRISGSGEA